MKRWISIVLAGTLSLILAGWALSQVPAALVKSGLVIGSSVAQGSGVHGTAVFSATGGTISALHVTGCVTGVTYNATGSYLVALSSCPANYAAAFSGGDSASGIAFLIDPVSSYLTTGFTLQVLSLSQSAYDPALIFVTIP
jgi:hypothetical protein